MFQIWTRGAKHQIDTSHNRGTGPGMFQIWTRSHFAPMHSTAQQTSNQQKQHTLGSTFRVPLKRMVSQSSKNANNIVFFGVLLLTSWLVCFLLVLPVWFASCDCLLLFVFAYWFDCSKRPNLAWTLDDQVRLFCENTNPKKGEKNCQRKTGAWVYMCKKRRKKKKKKKKTSPAAITHCSPSSIIK